MRRLNLIGARFGRLVVVAAAEPRGPKRRAYWVCRCDCGEQREFGHDNLRSGNTKSCGCFGRENPARRIHGQSHKGVYNIWAGMMARCSNSANPSYKDYGGRGITVCERWADYPTFAADMGDRPPGYQIERQDNNKGYEPSNCKWAPRKEQMRNRRNNVMLTFDGRSMCLKDWAESLGMSKDTLAARIRAGWPAEIALTTPPLPRNQRRSGRPSKSAINIIADQCSEEAAAMIRELEKAA